MSTDLTLDLVQSQLPSAQKLTVSEDTVVELNKLAKDPDYGPEFLDSYLDHLNILSDNHKNSHSQYLSAIKFFSLVEAGNSLTDAYIKTFPQRYEDRKKNHDAPDKSIMRGEASRYNNTNMINEIRRVAAIPVQLIHRHLLHEAILETADLMKNANSEMVRQKAADTLIRELKPEEDHTLHVKVEDNTTSVIEELRIATEKLAIEQHRSVKAGVPIKTIAQSKLHSMEEDETVVDEQ